MKTQRRHDLETNALAKRLAHGIDRVKPYTKGLAGVLVAAIVVLGVTTLVVRRTDRTEAAAWDEYYLATETGRPDLDQLEVLSEQYGGTSVEQWASIAWADAQLQMGTQTLFHDKNQAKQTIRGAIERYEALKGSAQLGMIRHRAAYGLGRAYEALGRVDDAVVEYDQVDGVFADMARMRAELLAERSSREFYDWFDEAGLPEKLVFPSETGTPGIGPDFSLD